MIKSLFRLAAIGALLGFLASFIPATAEAAQCGPRAAVLEALKKLKRKRVAIGASNSAVFELWASPDKKWTVTMSAPQANGAITCVMATGEAMETEQVPEPGQEA